MKTDSLIKKFAPELRFHRAESCYPSSVDWFLRRVALKYRGKVGKEILLKKPPLRVENLLGRSRGGQKSDATRGTKVTSFFVDIVNNRTKTGQKPRDERIKATCYAHVVRPPYTPTLDIQYWFFSPFNPQKRGRIGDHQGDWEHITVRLNRRKTRIMGIYFARHSAEGKWERYDTTRSGHPIVYVAKGSHASYPAARTYKRPRVKGFKVPTDYTSEGGFTWRCWDYVVDVGDRRRPTKGHEWLRFSGRWGGSTGGLLGVGKSPQTPSFKRDWNITGGGPFHPGDVKLSVIAHLQGRGDKRYREGKLAGTRGQSRRLEGFSISQIGKKTGFKLEYKAHVQNKGDTRWVREGKFLGSRGKGKRVEGLAIRLTGAKARAYNVYYVAHLQGKGDTRIYKNGQFCGTRKQGRRLEGFVVWIEAK